MTISPPVQFVIDHILADEGGVKDVGDGKGVTRYGQTPQWLEDNGFVPPTNAADAAVNYARWMQRFRLDDLCYRDWFTGWMVTDFAVHSGEAPAIRTLQRLLGVVADGVIGPKTLDALYAERGNTKLARVVLSERMRFLGELLGQTKDRSGRPIDRRGVAHGWLNRLADHLTALP